LQLQFENYAIGIGKMNSTQLRLTWATAVYMFFAPQAFGAVQSPSGVADKILTEVADIVAGINAHDVDRATRFDADNVVSMESGRPASIGIVEERQGLSQAFHYAPTWRLRLIEETADVANSGELAIYRSTYNEESVENGVPMTHRVNFIAEFRRHNTGQFKVVWSIVSSIEKSHKK
jgi:ketosteroid isomerase-like protein